MTRVDPAAADVRRAAWYALGVLAFVNLLNYGFRNSYQPVYDDLRRRFGFDDNDIGFVFWVYMASHALATLPIGWAGDRFDRRRVIALGLALASAGAAASAVAGGLWTFALTRAATGLGPAAVVPVANSILGEAFDGPKKAIALAVFNLGRFLGGVAGFGVGAALGFPGTFFAFAIPGALMCGVVAFLPVPPRRAGGDAPPPEGGLRHFLGDARVILRVRTLRWVMASATAMAFATGGYLVWLLDFLQYDKDLSKASASSVLGVSIIGGLAGVVTGGRLADRLRKRRRDGRLIAIVVGQGITVPCALLCIYAPPGVILYAGAILTMFFVSWYHGPIAASVDDLAPPGRAASAQSLVIFSMHALGTAPGGWIIGIVAGATSLTAAMVVNTAMVAVAVLLMARAARGYRDAGARAITDPR